MSVIFSYREFFGGISNDEYLPQRGGCYDCGGVEIRKKSKEFYLSNDYSTEFSISGELTCFDLTSVDGTYTQGVGYGYNGTTYYVWNLATGGTISTGTQAQAQFRNYAIFSHTLSAVTKDKLIIGERYVHRGETTDPSSITFSSWDLGLSSIYKPALVVGPRCYIGNKYQLAYIDSDGVLKANALVFNAQETVVGLTRIGDQIIIYTRGLDKSFQYFWDGVSSSFNRVIVWDDLIIRNVANFGNIDYVWTNSFISPGGTRANETGLFVTDGYQRTQLFWSDYTPDSNDKIVFNQDYTRAIDVNGPIVYLPGRNVIYSYGEKTLGLGKSLNREYTYTGGTTGYLTAISSQDGRLYYAYNYGGGLWKYGYKELREYLGYYGTTGYIITNPILTESYGSFEKFRIKYKLPHSSCQINIYRKVDDGSWTLISNIQYVDTNIRTFALMTPFNFNKLQFKIELVSSNKTYTPKVYKLDLKYDEIQDEFK